MARVRGHRVLEPVERGVVQVTPKVALEYEVHGTPAAEATTRVLLIMGLGTPGHVWQHNLGGTEGLIATAGAGTSFVTFDNRGTRATNSPWGRYTTRQLAADAEAVLNHLGWLVGNDGRRATLHICGLSLGGMIALELADRLRVGGVPVASLALCVTTGGVPSLLGAPPPPGLGTMLRLMFNPRLTLPQRAELSAAILYSPAFLATPDGAAVTADWIARREAEPPAPAPGALGQMMAVKTHFVCDARLAAIRAHCAVVGTFSAGLDALVPADPHMTRLAARLKPEEAVHLEGAGHSVIREDAAAFDAWLLRCVRRGAAAAEAEAARQLMAAS